MRHLPSGSWYVLPSIQRPRRVWVADESLRKTIALSLLALAPAASAASRTEYSVNPSTTFALTHVDPDDVFCFQNTWWLEQIQHQGKAAFNPNPAGYKVFRNVKDYGARGKSPPPRPLPVLALLAHDWPRDGTR